MASPIAEAYVRLRPDLTGFRAELQAQLNRELASVRPPTVRVRANVVSEGADLGAATQAVQKGIADQQAAAAALGSTQGLAAKEARQLATAQNAAATATQKLTASERAAVGATSELGAAQRTLTASSAAVTAAQRAFDLALRTGNRELQAATAESLLLARTRRETAVSTVQATRAEQIHSARLAQTGAGAGAAALSFTGLRGAVLAASPAFLAGTVAVTAFGKSLQAFATLEETLNVFEATTGATADQMERVSARAEELGADLTLPAVSAGDAADAMSALARAGLTVEQSMAAAEGVLQLATAAQIDNAAATELVANSLNAFSIAGEDATSVADAFANAANASQGSITDVGIAMQQVAAVSSQVGVSFEDTTSLLTLLAQAGLRGSDAGTSLRVALIRLAAPTDQAREALAALNIEIRDAQGQIRPEVFADFARATQDLSADTRDALAAEIFGLDAIRAANLIGRQGTVGLEDAQEAIRQVGTASELASARTEGLSGQFEALTSTGETSAAALGQTLAPAAGVTLEVLTEVTSTTGEVIGGFNDLAGAVPGLVDELEELVGADLDGFFGDLADGLKQSLFLMGPLVDGVKNLAGVGDETSNTFSAVGFNIVEQFNAMRTALDDAVNQSLDGAATGEVVPLLADQLRTAVAEFSGIGEIAKTEIPADIQDMIQRLADQGPAGRRVLRQLGEELSEGLAEGITDNGDAVAAARQAVREAAAAAAEETRDAIRDARGNLRSLGDTLSRQIGEIISEAGPAAQRLDALTEALERLQNQGQRRNVQFDLSQAEQALADMRATLAEIGSPNAAQQAAIDKTLAPFIENVKDAEDAVKEADLTAQIEQQEDLRDAAAKTAEEGIAKVVDEFEQGKISAAQFSQRITGAVAPALASLPKANLGLRFTQEFRRNLDTLLQQARDLAGFLGQAGTEPGAQSVNVAARAREAQGRVATAQQNLAKQLEKTTETADNTREANRLLRLINQKLGQAPPTRRRGPSGTRDPNTSGPDIPQQNMAGKVNG